MTLSSMVVSRDRQEVSILERILAGLHMDVEVERDPQQALTRITKSKIDALIVDCDLNGISQFLQRLEKQPNTVPLVIMGAPHGDHRMDDSGALFAFEKPISVEQAVRTLSGARTTILEGRLRYHRAGLEVPVEVNGKGRKRTDGYLVNVSQGGMRIRTDDSVEPTMLLQVSFELPRVGLALKAECEIAWQDKRGNIGIKFVKIAPRQHRNLQVWLAQQYFAN